jgi:hypothetical protein
MNGVEYSKIKNRDEMIRSFTRTKKNYEDLKARAEARAKEINADECKGVG